MWRSRKLLLANPAPNLSSKSTASTKLNRLAYLLIGGWALAGAIATGTNWERTQALELRIKTLFVEWRGPVAPPDNVVILAMDDDSFIQAKEYYQSDPKKYASLEPLQSWPWKRAAYAEVIEKLMQAGARAVAIDVLFLEPSAYGPADDQRLAEVLKRYQDRIVLAGQYTVSQTLAGETENLVTPATVFPDLPLRIGLINYEPEVDGKVHKLGEAAQLAALQRLGVDRPLLSFYQAALQAANIPIPPQQGDQIFYYYAFDSQGQYRTFFKPSFWMLLEPTNWQVLQRDQAFKDKIVLIGPTAQDLQDFQLTPLGRIPGVEVHAHALSTLMQGQAIAEAIPNPMGRGFLVLVGVLGTGLAMRLLSGRTVGQLLLATGIALVWGGASYGAFTQARVLVPTAVPMLGILLGGVSYLTVGALSAQIEQRRLRRTLERYVAAPIVQEILSNHSGDFQNLLKGRRIEAAILFSDVRGFTTLSYKLEPEQLVEQLNTYFNAMVEAILESGGTVDKFIGDAVMAEFGSPLSHGAKVDCMNAIRAALAMRRALYRLRQQWQQTGDVLFFNGIGINYGEVIAGDIGSARRREYAVIGDAVNVASRVEGMTKSFWTDILITDSLYQIVRDEVEVVDVGEHGLKGREAERVRLYSLIGLKGEDPNLYRQVCEELRLYLGGPQDTSNQS